jgi:hypothetical protein
MASTIIELIQGPSQDWDLETLKECLQAAVEPELSTLPPSGSLVYYLSRGPAYDLINSVRQFLACFHLVVLEEMLHKRLSCIGAHCQAGSPGVNGILERLNLDLHKGRVYGSRASRSWTDCLENEERNNFNPHKA